MKRAIVMWIDGEPETALFVRGRLHSIWIDLCWMLYPIRRINRWCGLISDDRTAADIARQMDEFMRVHRIRY